MDYAVIEAQSAGLQMGAESLKGVAMALHLVAESLTVAAMFFPAIQKLKDYLEGIVKAARHLADVMMHLANGLDKAEEDHKNGDVTVKSYFAMSQLQ